MQVHTPLPLLPSPPPKQYYKYQSTKFNKTQQQDEIGDPQDSEEQGEQRGDGRFVRYKIVLYHKWDVDSQAKAKKGWEGGEGF